MVNQTQHEIREVTLGELRKVTWDYAAEDIIGFWGDIVLRGYLFKIKNLGSIHPLTIQRCNVEEGWIEHIVCESYPDIQNTAEFFTKAIIKRDEEGGFIRNRVHQDVIVDLLGVHDNTILTLRKEEKER